MAHEDQEEQTKNESPPTGALVESAKQAKRWARELAAAKKWRRKFDETARSIEKVFVDQRDAIERSESRVNLFWANVQVTLAAIYGRLPKAEVDRKFRDFDDDVSRVAAEIMQRVLNADIEREHDDTSAAMRDAVQDRFVVGMGQVWCRYDVETEQFEQPRLDPMTGAPVLGVDGQPEMEMGERITNEEAETDYVYWKDFLYSPCRRWRDCRWVARRVPMSRDALKKRFELSDEQLAMVPMDAVKQDIEDDDVEKATPYQQAMPWEIWCKTSNKVYWYVEGCNFCLDIQDDPLKLDDFFPCPQPVVATTTTRAFLPVADYRMAQSMYKDLDEVNHRLHLLQKAVRVAGVFDKNATDVSRLVTGTNENTLIPVDNWSAFVEKGGMKGVVDWMPLEQIVGAIGELSKRKKQLEMDLYEVLGISDIMRGASVASETATAQQLKVQYGGARLANLQNEVARFVSAVSRIRANIIANHFQPQTLVERSCIDRTKDGQYAEQAVQMLKDFGTSMHNITVTADSLAAPDWQAEKEQRTELLTAVAGFVAQALPLAQANPQAGVFLLQMLQWGVAGFKSGRTLEGMLDQAIKAQEQAAQEPAKPAEPSPEDQAKTLKAKAGAVKDMAAAHKTLAETDTMLEQQSYAPMLPEPAVPAPFNPMSQ